MEGEYALTLIQSLKHLAAQRQPVKEKSDCLLPVLFRASSIYPQNNVPGDRRVAELLGKVRAWPTSASASPVCCSTAS